MYIYLFAILFFLIINFLISKLLKKYTYEKFFIYVIIYFILINTFNLIFLKDINLFKFEAVFSVLILFMYSGLYRSISVKIIVYLLLKKNWGNIYKGGYWMVSLEIFLRLGCSTIYLKKFLNLFRKSFLLR